MTDESIPTMKVEASCNWYEGVPLGNGDLGVIVYASEDALLFGVGKNDFWDRRLGTDIQPEPKPVCSINVWSRAEDGSTRRLGKIRHSLDLGKAELSTTVDDMRFSTRVQRDRNVVVLDISGLPLGTKICLQRHSDTTGTGVEPPRFTISRGEGIITQDLPPETTYPEGFRCAISGFLVGGGQPRLMDDGMVWEMEGKGVFLVSVSTTRDCADPDAESRRLLRESRENLVKMRNVHYDGWRRFWSRSSIWVDDPEMYHLWYKWMYMLGSTTKPGAIAPGLFSPWIVEDRSMWHGSYTIDYNFEQTYCSALSSNHAELMEPYFATVERMIPAAGRLAEKHGVDGLLFPHEMFPVELDEWPDCYTNVVETLWLVQHFWEHFLYTRNQLFLTERCFPILAACADLVVSLTRVDPGGAMVVPYYNSLEHPTLPGARNGTPILALSRYILKAAIEGARILGEEERIPRWGEVLERLPTYPRSRNQMGKIFVDCESEDELYNVSPPVELIKNGVRPSKLEGNHGAWMYYNIANSLMPVWPAGEIDSDSPTDDFLTAIRTWMTIKLEGFNNLVSHYVVAARLGIIPYREFMIDIRERRLPNGFETIRANRLTPEFDYDTGYFAYWTYGIYVENCGIPLVINEMMLQSLGGVIKVFPAFDPYRRAWFRNLLAIGGFLVSAEVDRGFVKWIEIEATEPGECRIRLPWPDQAFSIKNTGTGLGITYSNEGNEVTFSTNVGKVYRLEPRSKIHRAIEK